MDNKMINDEIIKEKNVAKEDDNMEIEEVNVYGYGCGDPRIGCMVDCINLTPWLTTQR